MTRTARRTGWSKALVAALALGLLAVPSAPASAGEAGIVGTGSSWSAGMLSQWSSDVKQFGLDVQFSPTGSSAGRRDFTAGLNDFAVSEIPYGLTDAAGGFDPPPKRGFAYLPVVAGGTAFMYNLVVAGRPVTNLRLSGATTAKIFTGSVTSWDDPAIAADNPNIALPARRITPVVRSDGSGTTAQFTAWMASEQPQIWNDFCRKQRIPFSGNCPFTSNYPSVQGFRALAGSDQVTAGVKGPAGEGSISYVEFSYALNAKLPVAKVLNASGYYVEPTEQAVAVGLLRAQINNDKSNRNTYLTQQLEGVYRSDDRRSYPLSSYSYAIIPTAEGGVFSSAKGKALGTFLNFGVCEGQQSAGVLGYSALPQNLVQASLEQIRLIPGVDQSGVDIRKCNNPTFSADGTNTVAKNAPQPPDCDKQGPAQCATGTAGVKSIATAVTKGVAAADPKAAAAVAAAAAAKKATAAGAAGATATAPATATGPAAAGAAVPETAAAADLSALAGAVDPETGEILAAGGEPGATSVSGIAVSAPGSSGSGLQTWLMVLAALSLLIATLGPPALQQRLSRDRT